MITRGQALYERAKQIIPGGTQLLSKRPELYAPHQWPPYASKSKGCTIWDLDGHAYLDMTTMGIGSCILGYADDVVNNAVKQAIDAGSMSTLNYAEEVELAELLISLHPWAQMVRFARSGGEILAQAIRIARASTGRERVVFCGYHGWHDWYLASNLQTGDQLGDHLLKGLEPRGVPSGLAGTAIPFHYNNRTELESALAIGEVAAVIMESVRYQEPEPGFLQFVAQETRKAGAVLIMDEVTAGFRHTVAGAHALYGIEPDMAVYAKALGNGFPCGAVVGKAEVMEAAQSTFISSTYWTERIGSVAALTTVKELIRRDVPSVLRETGLSVQKAWRETAAAHGISITIEGRPALCHYAINHDDAKVLGTLLTQEFLKRGILGNTSYYGSYAHTKDDVQRYADVLDDVFGVLAKAIDSGNPNGFLEGGCAVSGFTRLT